MGFIGGPLGYHILRRLRPRGADAHDPAQDGCYCGQNKLEILFGPAVWDEMRGSTVLDFGCGLGAEAIEMARHGARRVIGLDIREKVLEKARHSAQAAGVADRCIFTTATDEKADAIFSLDAFEHFDQPAEILRLMRGLVKDDGTAFIAFGPTWYHPLGGHLFSVFPWSHLVFTEKALLRWRADYYHDGATRFGEVEGGLNQITIRQFERLVAQSDFRFASFETVPIKRLRHFANSLTRELFTSFVRCRLVPR